MEASPLGPLTFDTADPTCSAELSATTIAQSSCCLLCGEQYRLAEREQFDAFLKHLLLEHKLVIADVRLIADFDKYVYYWKERFKDKPMTEFCTTIQTNSLHTDNHDSELYYLLADLLPEDKQLRMTLQKEKLDRVLSQQQRERNDETFSRPCLFCWAHFEGNRAELFNHMNTEHAFSVGLADNLVYTDEFLDVLQGKLDSLQCLYCEKTFKDRHILKEHMRKKNHKRINPRNTIYDRFYIINYLELGKNWEVIQSEDDGDDRVSTASSLNDDWSDWRAEGAEFQAVCLFCDSRSEHADTAMRHMKEAHAFDLQALRRELDLSFYQQVKLINYIRRQMYRHICPCCQHPAVSKGELLEHLDAAQHMGKVPAIAEWDQPQYYFPTFENDNLLCALDDDDTEDDAEIQDGGHLAQNSATAEMDSPQAVESDMATKAGLKERKRRTSNRKSTGVVIAEDIPVHESVLENESILAELKYS